MKIVLVGAGGYGQSYLKTLSDDLNLFNQLQAVVDPYASASSYYNRLIENKIPIYNTLDEFYEKSAADFVIVSSPIQFHEEQTITALNNKSHVLCEKPITATVKQAMNMKEAAVSNNRKLGVGFQFSFSDRIRALKQDILNNKFGKPVCLKSMLYWPRPNAYYETGNWKGRIKTADGRLVNDSVLSNATAHYLHNIFFVLGKEMNISLMPKNFSGSVFRFRNIESFDTVFLRGEFPGGACFYFCSTHSCGEEVKQEFIYTFEQAEVNISLDNLDISVKWNDGSVSDYAHVTENGLEGKVKFMIEAIENDTEPRCGVDTVIPHLTVTETIFNTFPIQNFLPEAIYKTENPEGAGVKGLYEAMNDCFINELLPHEFKSFPLVQAVNNEVSFV